MAKKQNLLKKNPLISLIIATYNEELHIGPLIDSIFAQSYKNWELIIVDDNSKDKTFEIIKKYSNKNKKIKIYKQKKDTRGPGNAWNLAIQNSKGNILIIIGADMVLGRNYIKNMINPILTGNAIGTIHAKEKIANNYDLWARAFSINARHMDEKNESTIFSAILREYYDKSGGFKSELGYADDQSLYKSLKIKSVGVNAEIYHYNPEGFLEIWQHHKWVGASYKHPFFIILMFPFSPLWIIYKTIKQLKKDFCFQFIFFLPLYNTIKYLGYFSGALRKLFFKRIY